ncbi:MAG: IMP dehydrogenase, partial [Deltaproteobacteria bacterium]
MLNHPIPGAYTFDDLLLLPAFSSVLPTEVDISTQLTPEIRLNIPIMSAAMDTVTEAQTAISMAREGGIGIIHKNMPVEAQVREIEKVKKSESGMIVDPVTVSPDQRIWDVQQIMHEYRI